MTNSEDPRAEKRQKRRRDGRKQLNHIKGLATLISLRDLFNKKHLWSLVEKGKMDDCSSIYELIDRLKKADEEYKAKKRIYGYTKPITKAIERHRAALEKEEKERKAKEEHEQRVYLLGQEALQIDKRIDSMDRFRAERQKLKKKNGDWLPRNINNKVNRIGLHRVFVKKVIPSEIPNN